MDATLRPSKLRLSLVAVMVFALLSESVSADDVDNPTPLTRRQAIQEEQDGRFSFRRGRIDVGNVIIRRWIPNLQTETSQDENGTVFVLTLFGNGDRKVMRISQKGGIRKVFDYHGWPYIWTKGNHLYALDLSLKTRLKSRLPGLGWRLLSRKSLWALAWGAGVSAVSGLNVWLHSGAPSDAESDQPFWMGVSAVAVFFVIDWTRSLFFRSFRSLGDGGNFFRVEVAKGFKDITEEKDDVVIHYPADSGKADERLSDLAPDFTRTSECIFQLTKINVE